MTASFSTVALLPMKAHSERVEGKNFRTFAGKPLFKWILDTLISCEFVDRIVINTDAIDILEEHGCPGDEDKIVVRQRPDSLLGDHVSMNRILENDIENIQAETYLMTHTTNPLLSKNTIEGAFKAYQKAVDGHSNDSLFTVNRFQTRFYREDGSAVNHDPNHLLRTQDLEPWFEENSNLYLFNQASFAATKARIGTQPMMWEMPAAESLDIDDHDSWNLAEMVALGGIALSSQR